MKKLLSLFKPKSKEKTPAEERQQNKELFQKELGFLIDDWGYGLVEELVPFSRGATYIAILRSEQAKKQIDIQVSENWIGFEFRRLVEGKLTNYRIKDDRFNGSAMILVDTNGQYQFISDLVENQKHKYIPTQVALLKKWQEQIQSAEWFDVKKRNELEDKLYFEKWGEWPTPGLTSFTDDVLRDIAPLMINLGFTISDISEEKPNYLKEYSDETISFTRKTDEVVIKPRDWRDDYYIYVIRLNGKEIAAFNCVELDGAKNAFAAMASFIKEYFALRSDK